MACADGTLLHGSSPSSRRAVAAAREAFLSGQSPPGRRPGPGVLEAWRRALAAGVDPQRREVPLVLDRPAAAAYAAESELARVAEPVLRTTHELLQETGYGVVLTDARGIVLKVAGDPHLTAAAERVRCLPGATWQEGLAGNNAIGTALALRLPVQFLYAEHFCAGWTDWTCAAAPIRDPEVDQTVGVLCICAYSPGSGCSTELWKGGRQDLPMVRRLAALVGDRLDGARQERLVMLAEAARQLRSWRAGSGAVALDRGGAPVWREGQVDDALWTALRLRPPALPAAGARAECELTVAGRFRCQAVPVWSGSQWIGYVLLAGSAEPAPARHPAAADGAPRLVLRLRQRLALVSPEQVFLLRARGPQVYALTGQGEFPVDGGSLTQLAERLAAHDFFRADRSYLVNLAKVREILPMFNRTLRLQLSDAQRTEVPVSRRRSQALRRQLHLASH